MRATQSCATSKVAAKVRSQKPNLDFYSALQADFARVARPGDSPGAVENRLRLYMHRAMEPHPYHLRDAMGIVAIRLVNLRLQHRPHAPRLNTDHWQACFGKSTEPPLRQRSSFQSNSLEMVGRVPQYSLQGIGFARYLHFPNDLACAIHNADARVLDRVPLVFLPKFR
jgi:hypothetical protein